MHGSLTTRWQLAAAALHGQLSHATTERLFSSLLELHSPSIGIDGTPTCTGCDADRPDAAEPTWPCRTVTLLTQSLLSIQDVEGYLVALRDAMPITGAPVPTSHGGI